ncbi:MAG: DUF6941 family protein [Elusimicrobiota bacterium]
MKVTMMLADSAQAVGGKLYILGGGWSLTGPLPSPSAIAVLVSVPWNETNRRHRVKVELVDADYRPVLVPTPEGDKPLAISGDFEVGRPPGIIPGSSIEVPFAFNIGPIPLQPDRRYVWKLTIDDKGSDDWQVVFSTRPAGQNPANA